MDPARLFNSMLALTAFVAAMAFAVADRSAMLAALAAPMIACAYVAGRRRSAWALPRLIVNVLVLAAIWNAAVRTLVMKTDDPIVSNLGEFLTFITVIKLFDRRSPRDDAQSLSLTLFLVIAAVLTSNALDLGLLLVIYVPLAVSTAMMLQLSGGQRDHAPHPPSQSVPPPAGRGAGANLTLVTAFAVLGTSAVAAGVFVLSPRGFASDVLGRFGRVREASVGFTDRIRLGQRGLLSDDPTPVFDVELLDQSGASVGRPDESLYLRAAVRDRYNPDTREWESSRDDKPRSQPVGRSLAPGSWCSIGPLPSSPVVRTLRFRFRRPLGDLTGSGAGPLAGGGGGGGWLFTSWRPTQIKFDHEVEVSIDEEDLTLRFGRARAPRLNYEVKFVLNDARGVAEPETPASFDLPGVRGLAERILAERGIAADEVLTEPSARRLGVLALRDWLRSDFEYTLELDAPPGGRDPIEWFLFERQQGHCEYFASALAALCQSLGVHARIVAGYVAADYNGMTGAYLVRQSNAHAWTEVHMGEGRWQVFDATPPAAIDALHRPTPGVLHRLRQWWEVLEFNWSTSVVGFDAGSQGRLFRGTPDQRGLFEDAIERLRSLGRWVGERARLGTLGLPPRLAEALPLVVVLAVAVFIAVRAVHRRVRGGERRRPRRAAAVLDPELRSLLAGAGFYPRALALLRRSGLGKPDHLPPLAHARSLADEHPEAGERFGGVARSFYQVRFGRRALSADEQAAAERATRDLELDTARRPERG